MVGTNLQTLLDNVPYACILSAEVYGLAEVDNTLLTSQLIELLDATGLRYMPATGCYEGNQEESFIVMCNDIYDVMRLECLAIHRFHQDSILIIDLEKSCCLLKYASITQMIGRGIKQIPMLEGQDNYTIVDGEIWVVD